MTIEEAEQSLLNYPFNTVAQGENIHIKIQLRRGTIQLPFRFDWFARMVELYGIENTTKLSIQIVRRWVTK